MQGTLDTLGSNDSVPKETWSVFGKRDLSDLNEIWYSTMETLKGFSRKQSIISFEKKMLEICTYHLTRV